MSTRPHTAKRIATLASLTALALVAVPSTAGAAGEGDVEVVNTETIQVYTDPTGKVQTKRVYEQISLTGKGSVELVNPIETDGLRNLDEFGGFEVKDGQQVFETTVDGDERLRSVSDFGGKLPLEVDVDYFLDGRSVEPGDVVGADGLLQVAFRVRNVTAVPQEVSFDDGSGGTVTKTVDVPIPMVGSLTTTAPSNFTDVASETANIAGDGKGGTKLSFTMTLFPPLGSDTAEFGYTARISDGVVPRADISALPVNPLKSATFKSAATSYQGGADTGARLAAGATTIDENLLKLRDGAGDLLAGLIKLRDGSRELSDGLTEEAAPGAARLASGAGELRDGTGQLVAGTGKLDDGAGELSSGAGRLDDGLTQLDDGVGDLDSGAARLAAGQKALAEGLRRLHAGVSKLPADVRAKLAEDAQYLRLLGALQGIAAGIGNRTDAPTVETLLGGLNKLEYGLDNPLATDAACDARDADRCGVTNALDRIGVRLFGAINGPEGTPGTVATLKQTILSIQTTPIGTCDAGCQAYVAGVANGVETAQKASLNNLRDGVLAISGGIKTKILADGAGLDRLRNGLSTGADPEVCATAPQGTCGIKEGALYLRNYGIPALVDGITSSISAELLKNIGVPTRGCNPKKTLRCAAAALAGGGSELTEGVDDLVAGVAQLSDGGALLADGAGRLAAGTGELDTGANRLDDGAGLLADGAGELADGLEAAGAGSVKIADGLTQASEGAPRLVDGADRLSEEGTKELVKAGEDTTQEYGELYATIAAGAERADAEGMAYGAPEGAFGLTAYSYVIKGEDGEGSRNVTRGLAGLVLLGLGGGALALRRRFI